MWIKYKYTFRQSLSSFLCSLLHLWAGKHTLHFDSWTTWDPWILLFFNLNYFNWKMITLQYCDGFCHRWTRIGHRYTCIPPPWTPLPHPSPLHLSSVSQSTGFGGPASCTELALVIHFTYGARMLSHSWLFATPRAIACCASLSMGFSRQEYWSGLPFPSLESSWSRDWTCVLWCVLCWQADSLPLSRDGNCTYDNVYLSMLFSQIIPPLPPSTESSAFFGMKSIRSFMGLCKNNSGITTTLYPNHLALGKTQASLLL